MAVASSTSPGGWPVTGERVIALYPTLLGRRTDLSSGLASDSAHVHHPVHQCVGRCVRRSASILLCARLPMHPSHALVTQLLRSFFCTTPQHMSGTRRKDNLRRNRRPSIPPPPRRRRASAAASCARAVSITTAALAPAQGSAVTHVGGPRPFAGPSLTAASATGTSPFSQASGGPGEAGKAAGGRHPRPQTP